MRTALVNRLITVMVLLSFLLLNILNTSAASVYSPDEDEDPLIKTLTFSFNGTCAGGVTVDPPDLNGQTTVFIGIRKELKYNVGTEVHITNNYTKVLCGRVYHTLAGPSSLTLTMDHDSHVSFSYYDISASPTPSPSVTPSSSTTPTPPRLKGDVDMNGQVNSIDFALFRAYLLGIPVNVPIDIWAADLDGDGKLTAIDFAMFRQYLLGMIESL